MTAAELAGRGTILAAWLLEGAAWQIFYSALLLLAIAPFLYLLRKGPASLRYGLWALVLARLVIPVQVALPINAGALIDALRPVGQLELLAEAVGPSEGWAPGARESSPGSAEGLGEGAPRWPLLVLAFWLVGTATTASRFGVRRRCYRRSAEEAGPVRSTQALAVASRWKKRLAIRREVRLLASPDVAAPFTLGTLRPVIVLPTVFLDEDDGALLESVIGHEMAHVRRYDDAQLLAQLVVVAVYFFYPAAWLALARAGAEREQACDDLVLARGHLDPFAYGRNLLAALKLTRDPDGPSVLPALTRGKRRLQERLESIIRKGETQMRRLDGSWIRWAALAIGTLLLATVAGTSPQTADNTRLDERQPDLDNPLPGARITSAYGQRYNPILERDDFHQGIDLHARIGDPILAPAAGIVEVATTEYPEGEAFCTVLLIDHGHGLKTLYSHLGALAVAPGGQVEHGQRVATVGVTGKTTGPHLHFEVWVNGEHRDPADFVEEWPPGTQR